MTDTGDSPRPRGEPARQSWDIPREVVRLPDVDVIVTARGGRETTEAIIAGGALLGFESSDVPPPFGPVDFIDWPFRSSGRTGWARHYNFVKRYEPKYAVAPDLQAGVDREWVFERAAFLAEHCETVIIPCKTVHPDDVPAQYRVGIPFSSAEWSGGMDHPLEAFHGREAHVLGGDPQRIYREFFGRFENVRGGTPYEIRSVDTSRPYTIAEKGEVWTPRDNRVQRYDLTLRERVALNVVNLRGALQPGRVDNFEQVLRSGRTPPALSEDMFETDDDRTQFERVMGETVDEFRRQTPGPFALPGRDPGPIDRPSDVEPALGRVPQEGFRDETLEGFTRREGTTDTAQSTGASESSSRSRSRQAGLDEWEPTTPGEKAVKEAIESSDADADADDPA